MLGNAILQLFPPEISGKTLSVLLFTLLGRGLKMNLVKIILDIATHIM